MSTEAQELHRIISTSVRDMLDAFRIQAQAGPLTDKALEEIIFRAEHGVLPRPNTAKRLKTTAKVGRDPPMAGRPPAHQCLRRALGAPRIRVGVEGVNPLAL